MELAQETETNSLSHGVSASLIQSTKIRVPLCTKLLTPYLFRVTRPNKQAHISYIGSLAGAAKGPRRPSSLSQAAATASARSAAYITMKTP